MLYLHVPFCHSKCIYCDFFSTPLARDLYGQYIEAMGAEIAMRRGELPDSPTSIYIGGGTPSILPLPLTGQLLETVCRNVDVSRIKEWTVEMNPEDVTPELLDLYARYGVNRISMGVQSFHDATLKKIGRRHNARQAVRAIQLIQSHGFNHSFDLIYGLPDEELEEWRYSLDRLLSFNPDHFSAYLLSYEPGTALYRMMERGRITEASEELAVAIYNHLCESAKANGYEHYEISNFARPGHRSYHNSRYWTGTPYLGIGCSAHSFTNGTRKANPADITRYIETIATGNPFFDEETESPEEKLNDLIITTLRTSAGMPLATLDRFPSSITAEFRHNLRHQLSAGHLHLTSTHILIPEAHWLQADSIMRDLII